MNKEIHYWAGINKYFKLNIDECYFAPVGTSDTTTVLAAGIAALTRAYIAFNTADLAVVDVGTRITTNRTINI